MCTVSMPDIGLGNEFGVTNLQKYSYRPYLSSIYFLISWFLIINQFSRISYHTTKPKFRAIK